MTVVSRVAATFALVLALGFASAPRAQAAEADSVKKADESAKKADESAKKADDSVKKANETVAAMKKADPGLDKFFSGAVGYAMFPKVGKGAVGVGGAHGSGVLFEGGKATGKTTMSQVTVGFQLGGQTYSEVVFFESDTTLANFKHGDFSFAAQVSAVAIKAGASANVKFQDGVAVFTMVKGGLMYEASVGGQKFGYQPFSTKPAEPKK
jgi:lipid-binding SYLF domain-containing protein